MPKSRYFELAAFPIGGRDVYHALVVFYGIAFVYAVSAALFGLPAITDVAGRVFGVFFPLALTITSGFALVGVMRSRHTGRIRVEYWGTLLLLAGFAGYAAAIIWRAFSEPDRIGTLPSCLLFVMLSVFPYFRLRNILKPGGGARPVTGEVPIARP